MFNPLYESQAELLIACIPQVAKNPCFALKGGTAINLFLRDLPRVSVDIDLTYLPLKTRDESLQEIGEALIQIKANVEQHIPGTRVRERCVQGCAVKLLVARGDIIIKIEPNLIIRGCVGKPLLQELSLPAQAQFSASARIQTLAPEDIYGGKLCAALDRQHPRDLFDVRLLLQNEGFSDAVRQAFLLVGHTVVLRQAMHVNYWRESAGVAAGGGHGEAV